MRGRKRNTPRYDGAVREKRCDSRHCASIGGGDGLARVIWAGRRDYGPRLKLNGDGRRSFGVLKVELICRPFNVDRAWGKGIGYARGMERASAYAFVRCVGPER